MGKHQVIVYRVTASKEFVLDAADPEEARAKAIAKCQGLPEMEMERPEFRFMAVSVLGPIKENGRWV